MTSNRNKRARRQMTAFAVAGLGLFICWLIVMGGNFASVFDQRRAADEIVRAGGSVEFEGVVPRVVEVSLGGNVTDADRVLSQLSGLTSLKNLSLIGTDVTDAGLVHLSGLTNLRRLRIEENYFAGRGRVAPKITDAGLVHFKSLTNLERLSLVGTDITDAGLVHLSGLTKLKRLKLNGTQLTEIGRISTSKVGNDGLAHLSGLTQLESLQLEGSRIDNAGLMHLKSLTNLELINLRYTQISDAGLGHLKAMNSLKRLWLIDTQVSDSGLLHLKGLKRLDELDLSGTRVSSQGVKEICKTLPALSVRYSCPFTFRLIDDRPAVQLEGATIVFAGISRKIELSGTFQLVIQHASDGNTRFIGAGGGMSSSCGSYHYTFKNEVLTFSCEGCSFQLKDYGAKLIVDKQTFDVVKNETMVVIAADGSARVVVSEPN